MNRILNWLKPARDRADRLEHKNHGNLIAFHANGTPAWSADSASAMARNGYCRNPVVHRCVSMIAQAAAAVPLQVCEDGIDCDQHPVTEFLGRPNPGQSGPRFLESVYSHLLISGSAFLLRLHLENELREVHALDPATLTVAETDGGYPLTYRQTTSHGQKLYSAEGEQPEILHIALFNPANVQEGFSPLCAAHMALDIHNAASEWNKALLDNSARPSGALVYAAASGDNLTDDQFERLKSELEEGYSGSMRAGRPMVLEGGLDWKAMGFSPRDMDFLEAKNGAAREIALALGVPPMLLGIPGDNTYSNYQEANRAFWTQTVLPLVEKSVLDISNWLAADFGGDLVLQPARDRIGALAHEREALWARIGQADFLTANEKREALGFAPWKDESHVG